MLLIPNGKQPCASELKRYIETAEKRFPVLHLMPMDRPLDKNDYPYLINRLASGRYAIKPNITRQSLLYMGMPLDESWQRLYIG